VKALAKVYLSFYSKLGVALLLFSLCRLLFYAFNYRYFSELGPSIWWGGLRYDWMTISILYLPFALSFIFFYRIKVIPRILFLMSTILAVVVNVLDFEYFKFTFKRTTFDLFTTKGIGADVSGLLPTFLVDYYYLVLIGILMIVGTYILYRNTEKSDLPNLKLLNFLAFALPSVLLWGIGFRGGLQYKPLNVIQAGEYAKSVNIPLVVNTPFTLIKSYGRSGLEAAIYFEDEDELNSIYSPLHRFSADSSSNSTKPNVILMIMESFSAEYIGAISGKKSYTPFLDSLIHEGLLLENAYANGKKSIEALPAILSSIPALMNNSYISSKYSANRIESIASVLNSEGYETVFYHGGANGTMGFDAFSRMAGVEEYVGLDQYPFQGDFDGNWGIFDEPFLQFVAGDLKQKSKPFFAGIFTLSSHHPYTIPEKYQGKFPSGELPILESVAYADYALGRFFSRISKEKWFDNTLFVLTADHTAQSMDPEYASRVGIYRIPLLFYHKGKIEAKRSEMLAQQSDIFPSIVDYLSLDREIIAFGNSIFRDKQEAFAVNYINESYQLIQGDYSLQFDGEKPIALFNYSKDPKMKENVLDNEEVKTEEMETKLKAIIQQYQEALIQNQLSPR